MIKQNQSTNSIGGYFSCLFYLLVWVMVSSPLPSFSQLDSQAVSKIDSINELAFSLRGSNLEKSNQLANTSLFLSEKHNYLKGQAHALNIIGIYHRNKNRIEVAKEFYFQSLVVRRKTGDHALIGQQLLNIGNLYRRIDQPDSAVSYLFEALLLQTLEKNEKEISKIQSSLGLVYKDLGEYEKALEYLFKNVDYEYKHGTQTSKANASSRVGMILEKMGRFEEAKIEYLEAKNALSNEGRSKVMALTLNNLGNVYLAIGNIDSAEYCYNESLALKKELGLTSELAGTQQNLGKIAYSRGQQLLAEEYIGQALEIYKEGGDKSGIAECNTILGEIAWQNGDFESARNLLDVALEHIPNDYISPLKMRIWEILEDIYSKSGEFKKAFQLAKRRIDLMDSINIQLDAAAQIIAQKDIEIALLANRLEFKELEAENTRFKNLLGSITGLATMLFMALIGIAQRQKSRRKLAEKENELLEQEKSREIDQLLSESSLKMWEAMAKGQAEERERIAHELHGHLGTLLASAKMQMEEYTEKILDQRIPDLKKFKNTLQLISKACEESRNISHGLSDEMVLQYGFQQGVKDMVERMGNSQRLSISFLKAELKEKLHDEFEILIFRLTQDLLSNILKHAKASVASIEFFKNNGRFTIMVEDNGIGFDPKQESKGMGLQSLRSRINNHKGELVIQSSKGEGTTVIIHLPVPRKKLN